MSVVIIGGNECMVCQYEKICKKHGCKAKVFVKEKSGFSKQIGNPDLMILFIPSIFLLLPVMNNYVSNHSCHKFSNVKLD